MLDATIAYLRAEGISELTIVPDASRRTRGRAVRIAQDRVYEARDHFAAAGAVTDDEWAAPSTALERSQRVS